MWKKLPQLVAALMCLEADARLLRVNPAGDVSQEASESESGSSPVPDSLLSEKAQVARKTCTGGGDPHVKTFDNNYWHPMHAPGHWWVIKSAENKLNVQMKYQECGPRGWDVRRWVDGKHIHRTCTFGISLSGSTLHNHVIVIQPACNWVWEKNACYPGEERRPEVLVDGMPHYMAPRSGTKDNAYFTYNPTTFTVGVDHDIKVEINIGNVKVHLPDGTYVYAAIHAAYPGAGMETYMDWQIHMNQGAAGSICGHCGTDNGNNGVRYSQSGFYNSAGNRDWGGARCRPQVACKDRLIPDIHDGCHNTKENWYTQKGNANVNDNFVSSYVGLEEDQEQSLAEKKMWEALAMELHVDKKDPAAVEEEVAEKIEKDPLAECDTEEKKDTAKNACSTQFAKHDAKMGDKSMEKAELDNCIRDVCAIGDVNMAADDAENAEEDQMTEKQLDQLKAEPQGDGKPDKA
jgi:hypothetical protein